MKKKEKLPEDVVRSPEAIIRRVAEQSTLFCFDLNGDRISPEDVGRALNLLLKKG